MSIVVRPCTDWNGQGGRKMCTFVETAVVLFCASGNRSDDDLSRTQKSTRRTEKRREEAWHKRNRRKRRIRGSSYRPHFLLLFNVKEHHQPPLYNENTSFSPPPFGFFFFFWLSKVGTQKKRKKKEVDLPTEKCSPPPSHTKEEIAPSCVCVLNEHDIIRHDTTGRRGEKGEQRQAIISTLTFCFCFFKKKKYQDEKNDVVFLHLISIITE